MKIKNIELPFDILAQTSSKLLAFGCSTQYSGEGVPSGPGVAANKVYMSVALTAVFEAWVACGHYSRDQIKEMLETVMENVCEVAPEGPKRTGHEANP